MQKSVQELIFDLESPIEEVRKFAVIWLAQVGDTSVIPHLRRLTKDEATAVRYFARRAIDDIERRTGQREAPVAATVAGEEWARRIRDDDTAERYKAAFELVSIDDAGVLAVARARFDAEPDGQVRALLVKGIAHFRVEDDVTLLGRALEDSDAGVRAEAVLALEPFMDPRVAARLARMVNDPDNRTRANALLVLGRHDEDLAIDGIREMASAPEIWMKDSAIFVCRALKTRRTIEILGRLYRDCGSDDYLFPKVKKALDDLAGAGDPTATRVVESLRLGRFEAELGHLDLEHVLDLIEAEIRGEGQPRERRVVRHEITSPEEMEAALDSPAHELRLSAVEAGQRLDPDRAREAFRRRLAVETHPFVLSKLAKELGRIGTTEDIPRIAPLLGHRDDRIRANAIEGLAFLGREEVYPYIRPLLDDPQARVKANAARVIFRIDRDRAFRTLKEMIASTQPGVSDSAIHALGEVWTDDVLELLELAFTREDQEVKLKIFKVLQKLAERSQVAGRLYRRYRIEGDGLLLRSGDLDDLMRLANDPDPRVRSDAARRLRQTPDHRARVALERLSRDPEPAVRLEAKAALVVWDLERERLTCLYQLGSTFYRAIRSGQLAPEGDLTEAMKVVEEASGRVDKGMDVAASLARRTQALWDLAQKALATVDPTAFAALPIEGIRKRIDTLDGQIRERLEELVQATPRPGPPPSAVLAAAARPGGDDDAGQRADAAAPAIARVLRWARDHRATAAAGATALVGVLLAVMIHRLGAAEIRGGWTSTIDGGVVRLVAAPGTVIALDGRGFTQALAGDSGQRLWRHVAVPLEEPLPPMVERHTIVAAGRDGTVLALDVRDGRKLWQLREGPLAQAPLPTERGVFLLVRGPTPRALTLDLATGRVLADAPPPGGGVRFALPLGPRMLLGIEREVRLVRAMDGAVEWKYTCPDEVSSEPLPFDVGKAWVVRTASRLVAIGPGGERLWEIAVSPSTQVFGPTVYRRQTLLLDGRLLVSLDLSGRVTSRVTLSDTPTAVAPHRNEVYYTTPQGALHVIGLLEALDRRLYEGIGQARVLIRTGNVLLVGTETGASGLAATPPRT